ncbi:hypothetical protein TNCV_4610781 [Trichonephila clavipes]|nr:hypothetical protein TNCV_4610781 [Trichonephila clavipes]
MATSVLGICGGSQMGSSFSFLYTGFGCMTNMFSMGDNFLFILQCTWNIFIPHLPEPTGPAEILLIVDGLQTFDVLPSSTGNFPLIVDGLHTFDVLSRRSAQHSSQCRCISYFFWSGHTYDRRTLFS